MASRSPKLAFLDGQNDEQDYFDNLIQIEPNDYKPNATSTNVHASFARTRILRGGLGSGKSRTGTEHINALAEAYPGSLHFIGRKDITSLKVTTQKEFLEFVVKPKLIETFNVNENTLYYKNGAQVLFRETKDPQKVKSLQLTSYMLDEADENETVEIWEKLDERLRQKIVLPDGTKVTPPYAGLLVFNPTNEESWLYELSKRTDISVEDFKFSTYDNRQNLPPGYIENLERRLSPWDRSRLLDGNWGRAISGKPVYHGFTEDRHVRHLEILPELPLLRGWDFGFNHPAVTFAQFNPRTGRLRIYREFFGTRMYLKDVVPEVKRITRSLVGDGFPICDYGDPHGADEKDTSESSIEYLRIHHNIFVSHRRERVRTGMEEIQEKIVTDGPKDELDVDGNSLKGEEPLLLVDPSARVTRDGFLGGYHRDDQGLPVKDGYFDHLQDTPRYIVVHNMNRALAYHRRHKRYVPNNRITGY